MNAVLYNPHILRRVPKRVKLEDLDKDFLDEEKENSARADACRAEFMEQYRKAKASAPRGVPLAYRLQPVTIATDRDDMWADKFGGLPDLYHDYFWKAAKYNSKMAKPEIAHWTPEDYVEYKWPRCKCCGRPMIFIAQLNLTAWMTAIHSLTVTPEKQNHMCFWKSGIGCTQIFAKYSTSTTWFRFWYCPDAGCSHFTDLGVPDAAVTFESRMLHFRKDFRGFRKKKGVLGMDTDGWKGIERSLRRHDEGEAPWTRRAYIKALHAFVRKYKVPRMPVELLHGSGYEICFDLDPVKRVSWKSKLGKQVDKFESNLPEPFKKEGNYQLFGAPNSQQEQRRYICSILWPEPHAMAPLLNWTDNDHDVTHQMYGCLGCAGQEHSIIHCKMDSSCT